MTNTPDPAKTGFHVFAHSAAQGHNHTHLRTDGRHIGGLDKRPSLAHVSRHAFPLPSQAIGCLPLEPRVSFQMEPGTAPSFPLRSASTRFRNAGRFLSVACHFCSQLRLTTIRQQESERPTAILLIRHAINELGCL